MRRRFQAPRRGSLTMRMRVLFHAAIAAAMVVPAAFGQGNGEHWVATWATSAQVYRGPAAPPRVAPAEAATPPARPRPPQSLENQTVRMIVHTSIGGKRLRLELTNPFGSTAVTVGAAHIALRDKDSAIVPASDRAITVNGSKSFKM